MRPLQESNDVIRDSRQNLVVDVETPIPQTASLLERLKQQHPTNETESCFNENETCVQNETEIVEQNETGTGGRVYNMADTRDMSNEGQTETQNSPSLVGYFDSNG